MFLGLTIKTLAALVCSMPLASGNSGFYTSCTNLRLGGRYYQLIANNVTGVKIYPLWIWTFVWQMWMVILCKQRSKSLDTYQSSVLTLFSGNAFKTCDFCRLGLSSIFCSCVTASGSENQNAHYDLSMFCLYVFCTDFNFSRYWLFQTPSLATLMVACVASIVVGLMVSKTDWDQYIL